jgi:hypothetical protein
VLYQLARRAAITIWRARFGVWPGARVRASCKAKHPLAPGQRHRAAVPLLIIIKGNFGNASRQWR